MVIYDDLKRFKEKTGYDSIHFKSMPTHARQTLDSNYAIFKQLDGRTQSTTRLADLLNDGQADFSVLSAENSVIAASRNTTSPDVGESDNTSILDTLAKVPTSQSLTDILPSPAEELGSSVKNFVANTDQKSSKDISSKDISSKDVEERNILCL